MDLTGRFFLFLLVMLTLICLTGCASTVTTAAPAHYVAIAAPPAPQPAPAPPDDGVALRTARISYIEGPVTMQRMADEDWTNAEINTPLMAGDKIFSGAGARVEIQLEDETVLRLGDNTYLEFKILDDGLGRIGIVKGVLAVHANRVSYERPPLEIISSYFASSIPVHAIVRYDVDEKGPARIQVRRGEVNVEKSDKSSLAVRRDEQLIVSSPNSADFKIAALSPEDDFDRWSDMRDAAIAASQTRQYVSTRVAGYSDLDAYGDWVVVKDYGRVWRPRVVATNWAPYRDGRWVWRDPYGWIWVSYEPWGWVPYHYGRWVYTSDYDWCWVPTDVVYVVHRPHRPLWYPAMVSFAYAHHGRYFSLSFGGGYYDGPCVGWFPLGPYDPFYPWYSFRASYVHRHHHGYLHRPEYYRDHVTINNNQTIIYQNQNVENAVTVMTRRDFESGQKPPRENAAGRYAASRDVKTGPEAFASLPERRAAAVQNQPLATGPDNRSPQTESSREPVSKNPRGDSSFEKVNAAPASANTQAARNPDAKPAREAAAAPGAAPLSQREANAKAEREPQANPTQEDRRAPAAKSSRTDSERTASPMTAPASAQSAREARSDANVSAPRSAAPSTNARSESFWNRTRSTRTAAPDNSRSAPSTSPARSGPEAKSAAPRSSDSSPWNQPRTMRQEAPRNDSSSSTRSMSEPATRSAQPSAPRASAPSTSSSRMTPQSANPSRSASPQRTDSSQSAPPSSSSSRNYDSGVSQPRAITPAQVPPSRQSSYMTPYDRRTSSSYSIPSNRSSYAPSYSTRSYSAVPQTYNSVPSYSPSRQSRMDSAPSRSYSPSYSVPRSAAPSYSVPRSAVPSYSAPRSAAPSYSAPSFSPQPSSSYSAPRMSSPAPSSQGGSSYSPRRAGR
ncbi:MAG: DUF6600 domain-containing protein [Candidatus Omnitrophota bacterium]